MMLNKPFNTELATLHISQMAFCVVHVQWMLFIESRPSAVSLRVGLQKYVITAALV